MFTSARRMRRRLFTAVSLAAVSSLLLSGCVLIQELRGVDTKQYSPEELIDANLAPELREFYEQEVEWEACPEEYAVADRFECATVSAPLNWDDPDAHEPIELALIRLPATGDSQGALFSNPGGPGASGIDLVGQAANTAFSKDLREHFDLVGWDPRGVGHSSAVECYDDEGTDEFFYGVPENANQMSAEQLVEYQRQQVIEYGAACLENTGPLLEYVDTKSTVKDLDLLRALLGDPKLNYFGFSYGTDIGAQYIDTYPERVGRIVLDGATDPTVDTFQTTIDQQTNFAESTRAYLKDCLGSPDCPFKPMGGVDGAIMQIQKIMNTVDDTMPKHSDGRTFTSAVIDLAITQAMYDESIWPVLTEAFTRWQTNNDASMFFALSDMYLQRDAEGKYMSNMFDAFTAINCLDRPLETDKAKIREYNEKLNSVKLFKDDEMAQASAEIGDMTCENWPVKSRVESLEPVKGEGAAPVLVVATSNDPATPVEWARAVADQLESATLIVLEGEGHIAYDEGNECTNTAVDEYFITGKVPESDLTCS